MTRWIGTACVLASLQACTAVALRPLNAESSAQLQGKSLTTSSHEVPDFSAMTASKAVFGLLGVAAMISEGNQIVKENSIADPALEIAAALSNRLVALRAMTPLAGTRPTMKSDDVVQLAKAAGGADYLVDVMTVNWSFGYYPTDWAHYRVVVTTRARLINVTNKTVIAESMCRSMEGDDKSPPDKDQLLENHAALLKKYLHQSSVTCADKLATQMLLL